MATIVVARWEGELDVARLNAALHGAKVTDEDGIPLPTPSPVPAE